MLARRHRASARPTAARGIRDYTFAIPPSRLIQIDIEPQEIGKIYPVEVGIVGDAKATLRELIDALRGARRSRGRDAARAGDRRGAKRRGSASSRRASRTAGTADPSGASAARDLEGRAATTRSSSPTSAGTRTARVSSCVSRQPRSFITSGGMATMGFAPAAAIARRHRAGRKVICLVGDGGCSRSWAR